MCRSPGCAARSRRTRNSRAICRLCAGRAICSRRIERGRMATGFYTHDECLGHVTPPGHPEQVARLEYVARALEGAAFAGLKRFDAPLGTDAAILRCHPQSYLDAIVAAEPATGTR